MQPVEVPLDALPERCTVMNDAPRHFGPRLVYASSKVPTELQVVHVWERK